MYLKKIGSKNKLRVRIQRRLISDNQHPMVSLIKIFNRSESHSSSRANLNPSVMQVQLTLIKELSTICPSYCNNLAMQVNLKGFNGK